MPGMRQGSDAAEESSAVKADPPPRADNLCFVCQKPRRVPKGVWARAEAELDAFCSSTCARSWHGCPLPAYERERKESVKKWPTETRQRYRELHRERELELQRERKKRRRAA